MNRREFLKSSSAAMALAGLRFRFPLADGDNPQIAITIDDPHLSDTPFLKNDELATTILSHLKRHGDLRAALFVCGTRVDSEAGKQLLTRFDAAGHSICNHSYSHFNYHSSSVEFGAYSADMLKCHPLISGYNNFVPLFRFPMLREGNTADKRDKMRLFLARQGYRTGYVSVDNSDWIIARLLSHLLEKEPLLDLEPYRRFYIEHMIKQAEIYDKMARAVAGRPVRQTLLTHFNLTTALFLGDLLDEFQRRGWQAIDALSAFDDPIYASQPDILPAGDSLVKALARSSGRFGDIPDPAGEDEELVEKEFNSLLPQ